MIQSTPCRILFVEDHEDTREVLKRLLESRGHEVVTAEGCSAALERAREERFHLLIADVGLPDGTGLELLKQIRRLYPIEGVAISGYARRDDIQDSEMAGYVHYLVKPINVDELFGTIDKVIERVCRDEVPVAVRG